MIYYFGSRSTRIKRQLHPIFQKILDRAIVTSQDDFGLHCGYRDIEQQHEEYLKGTSHIDGYTLRGYHNYKPALAVDFHSAKGNDAWNDVVLERIARHIQHIALSEFDIKLVWGGDWRTIHDGPHIQMPGKFRKEAEELKLY